MTRLPHTYNPPEELENLRILLPILLGMTLGDLCFLWNSFSYSVGDDFMALFMTVSTMLGIIGMPLMAARLLGASLDNPDDGRSAKFNLVLCIGLVVATVVVIVFVTMLRLSTASVTEGAASVATSSAASFGDADLASAADAAAAEDQEAFRANILVWMMTGLLIATAVFSFVREIVDCCMLSRQPMIDSYRKRTAPLKCAQLDAVLAGIQARSVQTQRREAERILLGEWGIEATAADQIIAEAEKDVAIGTGDPASLPIALAPTERFEGTYASQTLTPSEASLETGPVLHLATSEDEGGTPQPNTLDRETPDQRKAA